MLKILTLATSALIFVNASALTAVDFYRQLSFTKIENTIDGNYKVSTQCDIFRNKVVYK